MTGLVFLWLCALTAVVVAIGAIVFNKLNDMGRQIKGINDDLRSLREYRWKEVGARQSLDCRVDALAREAGFIWTPGTKPKWERLGS